MRRRRLLRSVGGALPLAVGAGCLRAQPAGDRTQPPDSTTVDTDDDPGDVIDDVGCPSFVESADRTNCYRTMSRDEVAVFVQPSTLTFEEYAADDEVETIRFTLHNTSERPFHFNPYDWAVYRHTETGWTKLAPQSVEKPLTELEPGATAVWSLATQTHPTPSSDKTRHITADLQSGDTHAFRVVGTLGTGDAAPRIECVAVFGYLRAVPKLSHDSYRSRDRSAFGRQELFHSH